MANAKKDSNSVSSLIAVSSVDLETPVRVAANPVTGALIADTTTTITGVATEDVQTDGSQKTQIVDGSGNVIGATSNALDINIKSGNPTTITATQGTASNLKVEATIAAAQTLATVTTVGAVTAITNALPSGTNAIGKLSANSGVDIGDVDVTSVITGTGATNLGKAEDAGHSSGDVGVMMLGVRNEEESEFTGSEGDYTPIAVTSKGAVVVSGTVDAIVVLNAEKDEDQNHSEGDTGIFSLGVRVDDPNAEFSNADGDYTPIAVSSTGAVRQAPPSEDFAALANGPQVKKYYTNAGAVTDGIIWSPAAGKRWYVTDIFIQVSAAATVTLEDDLAAGDSAIWKAELAANSGWSHSFNTPWFSGEDAADLIITTSAGNVYVTAVGYEI